MTILLFMCAIQNFNLNRGDLPFWRVSDPPSERLNLFLNSLLNASSDSCRFAATDCGIATVFFKTPQISVAFKRRFLEFLGGHSNRQCRRANMQDYGKTTGRRCSSVDYKSVCLTSQAKKFIESSLTCNSSPGNRRSSLRSPQTALAFSLAFKEGFLFYNIELFFQFLNICAAQIDTD